MRELGWGQLVVKVEGLEQWEWVEVGAVAVGLVAWAEEQTMEI